MFIQRTSRSADAATGIGIGAALGALFGVGASIATGLDLAVGPILGAAFGAQLAVLTLSARHLVIGAR